MSFVSLGAGGAALIGGGLAAGGSILSGILGSNAASAASKAQVAEEQQALAFQQQQLGKLDPWLNVGAGANYTLGSLYGIGQNGQSTNAPQNFSQFFNSPDYQFALQQGQAGLQNYENANGLAQSGAGLAAASTFNQGLATQQFGNYFNRLMGLSQLGASAANSAVGGGNAIANTFGNIGSSQASGIIGSANALTGGINGAGNNLLLSSLLGAKLGQPGTTAASPSSYNIFNPDNGIIPGFSSLGSGGIGSA